jgi:hypothetical protein
MVVYPHMLPLFLQLPLWQVAPSDASVDANRTTYQKQA